MHRLTRRLFRGGIHHFLPGDTDIAFAHRDIYYRKSKAEPFHSVAKIVGSRPLAVAANENIVCYGEYRANKERRPVHVWGSWDRGESWEPVWRFRKVRHVHGTYTDPYTGMIWVTTGDDDYEAGIWATSDNFRSIDQVAGGSQQLRAVELCFTESHVYFGSDTPRAKNHIYRIERLSGRIEQLQAVGSSVFFGCKVGEHIFFSTVAEPSEVNCADRAEIWHSSDGEKWRSLKRKWKDALPLKLFQYGQILFPGGPGDGRNLYYTPFATEGDQRTYRIPLTDISSE